MKAFATFFLTTAYLLGSISPALAASPSEPTPYEAAMLYARNQNILSPAPDGLMHPELPITREQLVTGIVRDVYAADIRHNCFDRIAPRPPFRFTHLFSDISIAHASAQEICVAMLTGLINGHADGSFRPQGSANLVEAAKVITKAYGIAPLPALRPQTRVSWHEPYWFTLAKRGAIPESVKTRDAALTRGEFAEILYRLREERPTKGFRYKASSVKAGNAVHAGASDQERYQSSDSSLPVFAPTHASLIRLHTEGRRAQRIEKLQRRVVANPSNQTSM